MNKSQRALWDKKAEDYEILKPFWDKLGKMGETEKYQRTVYDAKTNKEKPIGDEMTVSEAQSIYLQVRDTYSSNRDSLMYHLERRIMQTEADDNAKGALIAKLRKQFESGKITPYFPMSRFGKYAGIETNGCAPCARKA